MSVYLNNLFNYARSLPEPFAEAPKPPFAPR